jgi:Short C-terminal domain
MFMRRRRPLMRAAMVGGAGYMAGKAGQRHAYQEQEQDAQIADLQAQQQAQQAPPPAAPAAPAPAGDDMVSQLKQLGDLKASGVLSDEEFNAAKAKLIGS